MTKKLFALISVVIIATLLLAACRTPATEAPVATEAIAQRVWKKLGLTQQEIDKFYTGPAHLPWQRMGNIRNVDGPMPQEWHKDQINLQHKLLARMRELGMEPIIQSFAGFVPEAIKRIYPDIRLHQTQWQGGFPPPQRPFIITPDSPLFPKIIKMFIEEWKKEFGSATYFLTDSFNEMQLPNDGRSPEQLLAEYGKQTYNAIRGADENAVWVIQGWMFAYQRDIWNQGTIQALLSNVPDDKMLILDFANDYACNWKPFGGFYGKPWIYGFVPNMGGKTAYTGKLHLYASGAAEMLSSPGKGNNVGFCVSGEGLENNEIVYELLGDAAWQNDAIDLEKWTSKYCMNRYGGYPEAMNTAWKLMRQSCYADGNFRDHPTFGWQKGQTSRGSIIRSSEFFQAAQAFLSCSEQLKKSKFYCDDALEISSIVLGLKAEDWFSLAREAHANSDYSTRDNAIKRGLELLSEADRLLESHQLNRLEIWLTLARAHGATKTLKDYYEHNARRIVTIWGPPINDYSCRLWSGLIRDFYRERMRLIFEEMTSGKPFNRGAWELSWVKSSGISRIQPYPDPIAAAKQCVAKACTETLPEIKKLHTGESIGGWWPAQMSTEWKIIEWKISSEQLKKMKGVVFEYTKGAHRLDIQSVTLVADGKEISTDAHYGFAGTPNNANVYNLNIPANVQANNDCIIRASVRSDGGTDSTGSVFLLQK